MVTARTGARPAHHEEITTMAKRTAEGEGWTFWLIDGEVWRAATGASLDTFGHPMGKRWECSEGHWTRFRTVFAWAADIA